MVRSFHGRSWRCPKAGNRVTGQTTTSTCSNTSAHAARSSARSRCMRNQSRCVSPGSSSPPTDTAAPIKRAPARHAARDVERRAATPVHERTGRPPSRPPRRGAPRAITASTSSSSSSIHAATRSPRSDSTSVVGQLQPPRQRHARAWARRARPAAGAGRRRCGRCGPNVFTSLSVERATSTARASSR